MLIENRIEIDLDDSKNFRHPGPGFLLRSKNRKNPEAKIRGQFDGVVKSSSNRHAIVVNGHVYSVFS